MGPGAAGDPLASVPGGLPRLCTDSDCEPTTWRNAAYVRVRAIQGGMSSGRSPGEPDRRSAISSSEKSGVSDMSVPQSFRSIQHFGRLK